VPCLFPFLCSQTAALLPLHELALQTPEASKKRIANTGRQVDKSARTIKPFARQIGKDREA
jgi:hypothetical protein